MLDRDSMKTRIVILLLIAAAAIGMDKAYWRRITHINTGQ